MNSGKNCFLDINVQGVKMAMSNGLAVAYRIFFSTPSLESLRQRLIERNTDSIEAIDKRVKRAVKEIE